MAISVQCGQCGQRLSAKDSLAGRTVKCPKCGHHLSIPAPTPSIEPIGGQWDLFNDALPPPPPTVRGPLQPPAATPGRSFSAGPAGFGFPSGTRGGSFAIPTRPKSSNNNVLLFALGGGAALVVLMIGAIVAAVAVRSMSSPVKPALANAYRSAPGWTVDPALAARLGDPTVFVQRYSIRLPQGFPRDGERSDSTDDEIIMQSHVWTGPAQPDGTLDVFTASALQTSSGLPFVDDKDDKAGFLESVEEASGPVTEVSSEEGTIGGRQFLRVRFIVDMQGTSLYGFAFLGSKGSQSVVLGGMTAIPPGDERYNLLESVALTFIEH